MVSCVALVDFGFTFHPVQRGISKVTSSHLKGGFKYRLEGIMHWKDYVQGVGSNSMSQNGVLG